MLVMMDTGEIVEQAMWLTGWETQERRREIEHEIYEVAAHICASQGNMAGPMRWTELLPGDERVPEVPDHIQGPNVRMLVGTCDVLVSPIKRREFIGDLEPKDLERLRKITRWAFERNYPGRTLSDAQCDDVIDRLGPEIAVRHVRNAVDSGAVH